MEEINLDKTFQADEPLVLTTSKTSDPQIKIEGPMVRQSKSDGNSSAQVSLSQASDVRKPRGECAMGKHQYEPVPRKMSNKLIQTEIEGCQVFYRFLINNQPFSLDLFFKLLKVQTFEGQAHLMKHKTVLFG